MNIWLPKFNYYSKRLSMWQEKLWREVNGKPFMGTLDNVAGRKTFEYATFGRSGVQQSNSKLFGMQPKKAQIYKSVSMTVVANAAQQGQGPPLETQIDRGSQQFDADSVNDYFVWGYAFSTDNFFGTAAFGTMDDTTYIDGSSTSRTIRTMMDADSGGSAGSGDVFFTLDGTSITDSDATWLDITWDNTAGTPITTDRSVDYQAAVELNSDTYWRDLTPSASYTDADANTDFVLTTS